jgi:hypothetical protein
MSEMRKILRGKSNYMKKTFLSGNEKKKQLVLLRSGSIYFYGCHPFLCFFSPSSFIYENAKRSFVGSIINSVVLLITILSWRGRLKAATERKY